MGLATYTPMPNLQTSAFVERRSQSFLGESFGLNSYGGSANYSRALSTAFNASLTMTANIADNTGQDTFGFSTNENYPTVVSRVAYDRVVRVRAKRSDSSGHLHELVLQLLRHRKTPLGKIQRQHWTQGPRAPPC